MMRAVDPSGLRPTTRGQRSALPTRTSRHRPFGTRPPLPSHHTPLPTTSATATATATSNGNQSSSQPSTTTAPLPAQPTQHPRRSALVLLATTAAAAAAASLALPGAVAAKSAGDPGDWSSPGLGAPVDPSQPLFVKLPSGVRYQELNVGSGPAAASGDTVLFDYVLRRSNGYFIYGTVEGVSFQPRDVPVAPVNAKLGSGELIPGLEEVLSGMTPGSKRRALIPPELGYLGGGELPQPPTFSTKRQLETHRREPLLFEVQMLRVGGRKQ